MSTKILSECWTVKGTFEDNIDLYPSKTGNGWASDITDAREFPSYEAAMQYGRDHCGKYFYIPEPLSMTIAHYDDVIIEGSKYDKEN